MKIGISKLIDDLSDMKFDVSELTDSNGAKYAVINNFNIPAGSFAGRVIDLAIPAPPEYPRLVGASIHIKAIPHLVEFKSIPNLRNVVPSALGNQWQYWSYNFNVHSNNTANELITKINEIFRKN